MNAGRSVTIDLARTLAIAMMVTYHIAFDLEYYEGWDIGVREGGWLALQIATATLFLLLVGISSALRWKTSSTAAEFRKRTAKRASQVLLAALAVTVATYLWDPSTFIRFGILHCIGVTVLLLPILSRLREDNAAVGLALIGVGMRTNTLTSLSPLLLPLGITPPMFTTLDYYPLLPWAGVILIGYAIGHLVYVRYPDWRKQFSILHSQFSPGPAAILSSSTSSTNPSSLHSSSSWKKSGKEHLERCTTLHHGQPFIVV